MEEQPRDAENTTRAFFKEYMVNRNVEATLDWLMDDVQWIGTGKGEYSCGKEQVLKALDQEFSLDPDAYQIIWEDIKESRLTSDCAVMQGQAYCGAHTFRRQELCHGCARYFHLCPHSERV